MATVDRNSLLHMETCTLVGAARNSLLRMAVGAPSESTLKAQVMVESATCARDLAASMGLASGPFDDAVKAAEAVRNETLVPKLPEVWHGLAPAPTSGTVSDGFRVRERGVAVPRLGTVQEPATAEMWSEVAAELASGTLSDGFRSQASPLQLAIQRAAAKALDRGFSNPPGYEIVARGTAPERFDLRLPSGEMHHVADAAKISEARAAAWHLYDAAKREDTARELCILALQIGGPESVRRFADAWCGEGK